MTRRSLLQRGVSLSAGALLFGRLLGWKPVPLVAPMEPAAVEADLAAWSRTYPVRTYALGVKITQDPTWDDLYGFYEQLSRDMAALEPGLIATPTHRGSRSAG